MLKNILIVALVFVPINSIAADTKEVATVVEHCVNEVHKANILYAKEFDAFYNPSTKNVENNAFSDGYTVKGEAFYLFRKCMAKDGFPLGPGK